MHRPPHNSAHVQAHYAHTQFLKVQVEEVEDHINDFKGFFFLIYNFSPFVMLLILEKKIIFSIEVNFIETVLLYSLIWH